MPRVYGVTETHEHHLYLSLAPNQRLYVNDPSQYLNFNLDQTYIILSILAIPPTPNWRPSQETKGYITVTLGDKPQLIASHNILMSRYVALASLHPVAAPLLSPIVVPVRQSLYLENKSEASIEIEIIGLLRRDVT